MMIRGDLVNPSPRVKARTNARRLAHGQRAAELLIANFRYWPDKAVCRELDLSFGTWRAIKTRRHHPSNPLLTHLFKKLGPNFVAACVAPWAHAGPTVAGFKRNG